VSAEGLAGYIAAFAPLAPPGHAERIAFVAATFGIRAEVILAQQLHETGLYAYGGCGTSVFSGCPEFNNYAGIKNTETTAIAKFESPFLGCIAQAAHLAWYAVPKHVNALCGQPWDPRHFGAEHRATSPEIATLGGSGRWAPSPEYGEKVLAKMEAILTFDGRRRVQFAYPARLGW
jgi:hypothetical protein